MSSWGGANGRSGSGSSSIHTATQFPCLDVLHGGFLRQHCEKCLIDVGAGTHSRKRGSFIIGCDPETREEQFYRIPYAYAEQLAVQMVEKDVSPGVLLTVQDDQLIVHPKARLGEREKHCSAAMDDSIGNIALNFVDNNYTLLTEGVRCFWLQGKRPAPYILIYHDNCRPSARDVQAYEERYSRDIIQYFDTELRKKLAERPAF